jgi:hypothetical protein
MLLTSKMTSTPYLVMLLIPLSVLVHDLFHNRPDKKWIFPLAASYGVLTVWYPLPVGKFLDMDVYEMFMKGLQVHVFSLQFFALLVLWLYFVLVPLSFKNDSLNGDSDWTIRRT